MGKNYRKTRDEFISAKGYRNHADDEASFSKRHNRFYLPVDALTKPVLAVNWNSAFTKKLIKNRFRPMHEIEKILRGHYTPDQIRARLKEVENDEKYRKYFETKKKYSEEKKGGIEMANSVRKLTDEDYKLLWESRDLKESAAVEKCKHMLDFVQRTTIENYISLIKRECRGIDTGMPRHMWKIINSLHEEEYGNPLPSFEAVQTRLANKISKPLSERKSAVKKMGVEDYKNIWQIRDLSMPEARKIHPYLFDGEFCSSKTTRNYMTIMRSRNYDKMPPAMREVAQALDANLPVATESKWKCSIEKEDVKRLYEVRELPAAQARELCADIIGKYNITKNKFSDYLYRIRCVVADKPVDISLDIKNYVKELRDLERISVPWDNALETNETIAEKEQAEARDYVKELKGLLLDRASAEAMKDASGSEEELLALFSDIKECAKELKELILERTWVDSHGDNPDKNSYTDYAKEPEEAPEFDFQVKFGLMLGDDLKIICNSEEELKGAELAYTSLNIPYEKVKITIESLN